MKKIINLPLKGSIAFLLNDADMRKLGFGLSHEDKHVFALCDSCIFQFIKVHIFMFLL